MNKKCYIMRGCPGSGKNYWIEKNLPGAVVISTDDYHMVDGEYQFQVERLAEFHNKALLHFIEECSNGEPVVVCNNTNIRMFEIAPYYRVAEAFGYEVEVIWMIADPEVCKASNVHGVPDAVIDSMVTGVDPLPSWWKVRLVLSRNYDTVTKAGSFYR